MLRGKVTSMKKEQMEIELNKVITELSLLEEQANLETATTQFLGKETDKLMIKVKDDSLSFEEKEQVYSQMAALQGRLTKETMLVAEDMRKLSTLHDRFNYLQTLSIEE